MRTAVHGARSALRPLLRPLGSNGKTTAAGRGRCGYRWQRFYYSHFRAWALVTFVRSEPIRYAAAAAALLASRCCRAAALADDVIEPDLIIDLMLCAADRSSGPRNC